jgi:hypothetical protein
VTENPFSEALQEKSAKGKEKAGSDAQQRIGPPLEKEAAADLEPTAP